MNDETIESNAEYERGIEPLLDRGIDRDVIEARGYTLYFGQHHALFDRTARDAMLVDPAKGWPQMATRIPRGKGFVSPVGTMKRQMSLVPDIDPNDPEGKKKRPGYGRGLIMPKHPFPIRGLLPIYPQLRPEVALERRRRPHHHLGWRRYPVFEKSGNRVIGADGKPLLRSRKGSYDLDDVNSRRLYERHIREEHDGDFDFPEDEIHWHDDEAKYTLPVGRPGQSCRLDIHPFAVDLLPAAERIYFALEGTPKADSILSYIRRHKVPASIFDTPSVTTWKAAETRQVADRWLARPNADGVKPLLVIVCDADWYGNEAVLRQALYARYHWEGVHANVCIAAPPIQNPLDPDDPRNRPCGCSGHPPLALDADVCSECRGYKKGVDDYLAAGGDLDLLMVVDRRGAFRLANHADSRGLVKGSYRSLAGRIEGSVKGRGCRKTAAAVEVAIRTQVDQGYIEVVQGGSLEPYVVTRAGQPVTYYPTVTLRVLPEWIPEDKFMRLWEYRHDAPSTESLQDELLRRSFERFVALRQYAWITNDDLDAAITETSQARNMTRDYVRKQAKSLRNVFNATRAMIIKADERDDESVALAHGLSSRRIYQIRKKTPEAGTPISNDEPRGQTA